MKRRWFFFSRFEKITLVILGLFFLAGIWGLLSSFYDESTISTPAKGGIYREGVIGNATNLVLNPVFVYGKRDTSIDSDISSLLFSGLMKFDTKEGKLKDHIATHTLSSDKKTYVFRVNEGMKWHDGVEVTAEDVYFTFHDVIQHPDFSNESLKKAFEGVNIEKISDSEVSFQITFPYKYFLTNFTVGILPKHILEDVPVANMEYSDFNQNPIGNGAFQYASLEESTRDVYTMRLEPFDQSSLYDPFFEAVEFVIYRSHNALSLGSKNLTAIRPIPEYYMKEFSFSSHLTSRSFALPQYSALFFNMKKPIFQNNTGKTIRLGLQLATNKTVLEDLVGAKRIDTPLLEPDNENWIYEFDLEKANGAMKDAGFFLPSSKPKTFTPQNSDKNWITQPSTENKWEGSVANDAKGFTIAGTYPLKIGSVKVFVNDIEKLYEQKPELSRKWSFEIPFDSEFKEGTSEIRIQFFGFKEDENNEEEELKLLEQDAVSVYIEREKTDEEKAENEDVSKYEIREDKLGKPLSLKILTAERPTYYPQVAEYIAEDWRKIGVDVQIEVLSVPEFLDKVLHREYDILLYGQNLGYNLDIYEFFHESQVGKDNISDYQNQNASVLIEEIRSSHIFEERSEKLQQLREILKKDIPAIFLFSPIYNYYSDPNIQNMNLPFIAFYKDRFAYMDEAHVKTQKSFKDELSWFSFPSWFSENFISFISLSL